VKNFKINLKIHHIMKESKLQLLL